MDIMIEGWQPTPLERSLIDGSLDRITTGSSIQDILEDLSDVQLIDDVMDDLKNEIRGWHSRFAGCDLTRS